MTLKTAANRYARALFEVALQEKADLERVGQDLAGFNELLDRQETLKKILLNPAVPVPRKRAAVVELTARAGVVPTVGKLLALLAERDRLIMLPDLVASYRERLLEHQQIVRAELTTAAPLDAARMQDIEQRLVQATGRKVRLQAHVNPAIIGGLVARIGSTVYDGSVTRQLEKMKQRLVENV